MITELPSDDAAPTRLLADPYPDQKLPEWAGAPLANFLASQEEARRLLDLSRRSLEILTVLPDLFRNLEKLNLGSEEETAFLRELDTAEDTARFAAAQRERDFPLLHQQATVALWGAIEVCVEDLVIAFLEHGMINFDFGKLASLNVPLQAILESSDHARAKLVLREFERQNGTASKPGVAALEGQLEIVKLQGSVDETIRRSLLELSQVRYVAVHRGGMSDERFITYCPWLASTEGTLIVVNREMHANWTRAAYVYVANLVGRAKTRLLSSAAHS